MLHMAMINLQKLEESHIEEVINTPRRLERKLAFSEEQNSFAKQEVQQLLEKIHLLEMQLRTMTPHNTSEQVTVMTLQE
jgi:hypothetical protein